LETRKKGYICHKNCPDSKGVGRTTPGWEYTCEEKRGQVCFVERLRLLGKKRTAKVFERRAARGEKDSGGELSGKCEKNDHQTVGPAYL